MRDIFVNITILVSFLFIVGQVFKNYTLEKESPRRVKVVTGVICGFMGMILMIFTIKTTNITVIIDLRNIAIICGAIFGGPIGSIISSIMVALFRLLYFGIGTASIIASITTILIGIVCAYIAIKTEIRFKKYIYMFLISNIVSNIMLVYLLKGSEGIGMAIRDYWLAYIFGGALAYYTCEYIILRNRTFKEMSYYQIMAENLLDMITIHKFDGTYKYASASSMKLLGCKPEEMVGNNFFDYIHPDDIFVIKEVQKELNKERLNENTKELRLKNKFGEYIWVESTFKNIKDIEGKNKEIICASRDINERKKIEERLKTQTAQAIEANRLKSQFLANMSHELRTPLNSIIGFTTRVLKKSKDILPETQSENLEIVKDEANHLLVLINDLLDYSKIEAGKMSVSVETFDLESIIGEAISMTENIGFEKGLKFEKIIGEDIDTEIKSDRIKLKQVITNLLSNAFKYSDSGTVKLSVEIEEDNFKIKISDEGIGITEEDIKNIFEEFHQVDGSYTRKVGGTGLGLAITKRLADILLGSIEVESTVGVGSSFTVYIPKEYYKSAKSKNEPIEQLSLEEIRNPQNKVIAFIEDDFSTRKLYSEYLKDERFNPVSIDENQDFNDMIEDIVKLDPLAVILDVMLQSKDGWEILNELKQNEKTKHIPVIMSSALNEQNIAYKLKADDYLVKPVLQEELISSIYKITKTDSSVELLIVDDDKNYLKLLSQYIDETKMSYIKANDGAQAIEMIEKYNPGLVILDIMMPKMTGFEVLDWIRNSKKHESTSVIVVSAKDFTNKEKKKLSQSANMVINKSGRQVEDIIKKVLSNKGWK